MTLTTMLLLSALSLGPLALLILSGTLRPDFCVPFAETAMMLCLCFGGVMGVVLTCPGAPGWQRTTGIALGCAAIVLAHAVALGEVVRPWRRGGRPGDGPVGRAWLAGRRRR